MFDFEYRGARYGLLPLPWGLDETRRKIREGQEPLSDEERAERLARHGISRPSSEQV